MSNTTDFATNTDYSKFSYADFFALFCGLGILLAFIFMPWINILGTGASGLRLLEEAQKYIQGDVSMLLLLPLAAAGGIVGGILGIISLQRKLSSVIELTAGLVGCAYYGLFLSNNSKSIVDLTNLVNIGFWVSLFFSVSLVLQIFLPRPSERIKSSVKERKKNDLISNTRINNLGIIEAALRYSERNLVYILVDVETDQTIDQITEFQLNYLKAQMLAPRTHEEGWFFPKTTLSTILDDYQILSKSANDLDNRTDKIKKVIAGEVFEDSEDFAEADSSQIERLIRESQVLLTKANELEKLHDKLEQSIEDFDAIEVIWKKI